MNVRPGRMAIVILTAPELYVFVATLIIWRYVPDSTIAPLLSFVIELDQPLALLLGSVAVAAVILPVTRILKKLLDPERHADWLVEWPEYSDWKTAAYFGLIWSIAMVAAILIAGLYFHTLGARLSLAPIVASMLSGLTSVLTFFFADNKLRELLNRY